MTTTPFRLAVIDIEGADTPVVEYAGSMLPVWSLLPAGEGGIFRASGTDLSGLIADWPSWAARLPGLVQASIARFAAEGLPADAVKFRCLLALPRKLICIGSNYHDHIAEMRIPMLPTYPYSFFKPASTTLRASGEAVQAPAMVSMLDYEAELAVVIGRGGRSIKAADARHHVAGYANFNDLSARDWIEKRPAVGMDWTLHKAFDGFSPMGPYLQPAMFVADPQDLPVKLSVNGMVKQESNTAQMIFGIDAIIEHLSSIMTLEPGDVIATGTPAGVGNGRNPPEFLQPGDVVQISIGELGELVTPIV